MTAITGKHLKPVYYGYKGGFAKVTICEACGNTGLYEDQHPVNPCNNCGGTPIENFTAMFDGGKWVNLKVFKLDDMHLYYQGSIDSIIEKSIKSSEAKASLKKADGKSKSSTHKETGVFAKFFPSLF